MHISKRQFKLYANGYIVKCKGCFAPSLAFIGTFTSLVVKTILAPKGKDTTGNALVDMNIKEATPKAFIMGITQDTIAAPFEDTMPSAPLPVIAADTALGMLALAAASQGITVDC